jgi:hypothetical protein
MNDPIISTRTRTRGCQRPARPKRLGVESPWPQFTADASGVGSHRALISSRVDRVQNRSPETDFRATGWLGCATTAATATTAPTATTAATAAGAGFPQPHARLRLAGCTASPRSRHSVPPPEHTYYAQNYVQDGLELWVD